MCGIAGMAGPRPDANVVARMTATLRHRGPDGSGFWCDDGVALGHRRLKILDLSEAGRQPMATPDGRFTIVYNGEVYNYRELRTQLPGTQFRSQTDTEVVLHSYARWGPACLERFVGMFAFAIWDATERKLFCARDRLGIKPFYFAQQGEHLVFASEIRALLAAGVATGIDQQIVYDFLARDFYEHTDHCFFSDIYKLPAGTWMTVGNGKASQPQRYWDLASDVERTQVSAISEQREDELLSRCEDAVRLHLRSDVPIGVALSGGLDSATLLALLDRTHSDPTRVEAFSCAYTDPAYSERPFVMQMAKETGRPAHFLEISPQRFIDTVERICIDQEEPHAGAPVSAYALCFEMARQKRFIVIMDGTGVDEGLAGYGRFQPARWADLFFGHQWDALEHEFAESGVSGPDARRNALNQMYAAAQPHADIGMGQDLTKSARADCLASDFVDTAGTPVPEFSRPFPDCLRNLMYRELRYTKLPRALRFRDKLSMAVGAELRPPFLDHRLLAYEFALPGEDRIHRGVSKAILRRATARLLPTTVRLASKRSVQTPQREWFRSELQDWVRAHIDTPRFWQRGWIDEKRGRAAMEAFFSGEGNNSFFLWQWINLEMWAERFIDGPVHD